MRRETRSASRRPGALESLREIMGKLKLTVNEEKTRICKVPPSSVDESSLAMVMESTPRVGLSPRFGLSISWSGKRNFVGRDWRAISAAECGRTAGIRFADRDTPH